MIRVTPVAILDDNYCFILTGDNGFCAVVDPGDAAPVIAALEAMVLRPRHILITHHHGDHVAGVSTIQRKYGCLVTGPAADAHRLPDIGASVSDEDILIMDKKEEAHVIATPGHTSGHVCYHFPASGLLFAGDTLFLMGCGRVLEGTHEQLWNSLRKLKALPGGTRIYCGHEYTLANARFAASVAPDNEDIQKRLEEMTRLRERNMPTLPGTIAAEQTTNVFMMAETLEEFTALRQLKDRFR